MVTIIGKLNKLTSCGMTIDNAKRVYRENFTQARLLFLFFFIIMTNCTSSNDFYIDYKEQKIYSIGGTLKYISIVSSDQTISESLDVGGKWDFIFITNLKPHAIYAISNMGGDRKTIIKCYKTDNRGMLQNEILPQNLPDSLRPIESWGITVSEPDRKTKHLKVVP